MPTRPYAWIDEPNTYFWCGRGLKRGAKYFCRLRCGHDWAVRALKDGVRLPKRRWI